MTSLQYDHEEDDFGYCAKRRSQGAATSERCVVAALRQLNGRERRAQAARYQHRRKPARGGGI